MTRSRARKSSHKKNEMPAEKREKSFTSVRQSQSMPVKRKTSENLTGESKKRKISERLFEKNEKDEEASTPPTSQDIQDGDPVEAGEEGVQDPKENESPHH